MTYSIHITKGAEKDMERAADYIEFSLKNPQAADSLLNEAEKELGSLSVMPERYALVDDPLLASWGIRFVRVKQYLAFYVITPQTRTVHILRFLYGKSDWAAILYNSNKTAEY